MKTVVKVLTCKKMFDIIIERQGKVVKTGNTRPYCVIEIIGEVLPQWTITKKWRGPAAVDDSKELYGEVLP